MRALFPMLPELDEAGEQAFRNELRDGLSALYVALTRARYALHIIARPGRGNGRTAARAVLRALVPERDTFAAGDTVLQRGRADWHDTLRAREERVRQGAPVQEAAAVAPVPLLVLKRGAARTRALPRRSPSQLEGGGRVDLGMILRGSPAAERGLIVHRWFEAVGWLEDGLPTDAVLRRLALEVQTSLDSAQLDALIATFRNWLELPAVARLLRRDGWPAGAAVEREVPFITRAGDTLVEGRIDRLVLVRTGGRIAAAAVIDYKTDAIGSAADMAARATYYRPQLDAYRSAVARMYGLAPDAVEGWLVFLDAGRVVRLATDKED
jgi:ATP-dependent exoDNAse (exonuclease V) beta subunit